MTLDFKAIRAVIMDMDGVLWRGDLALPHVQDFVRFLQARQIPIALATNNSSKHPRQFITKLETLTITGFTEAAIITSGTATADYLRQTYADDAHVHLVGADGLRNVLQEAGVRVSQVMTDDELPDDAPPFSAVVVGIDKDFTYAKALRASQLARRGIPLIATNPDTSYPTPEGLAPGAGSLVQMIAAASDVTPLVIGKPASVMFTTALQRLQATPATTLMIGDRLNTDIAGAQKVGLMTTLVMTGVSTPHDVLHSPIEADVVATDLADLQARWQAAT